MRLKRHYVQLGMLSGPATLRGLTRLNILLTSAMEENTQSLVVCRVGGTVLSSKRAKKLFHLSGSKTLMSATGLVFFL